MNLRPSFQDEHVLWQDFLAGDVPSFEKLMADNFRMLFQYGSKFSKDREFVKDSIQDLFLILWEKKSNLNPDAAVKPYLMASLRRLMRRNLTSSSRIEVEVLRDEDDDDFHGIECSVEDQYIVGEMTAVRSQQLQKLINDLPCRQKEVVYLKFFQELNRDQIAEVMAVSPQTVSNMLQIAIRHLKLYWKTGYIIFFLLHLLR
jgi:RNA polymerase sigma factor (sigma-70 family)